MNIVYSRKDLAVRVARIGRRISKDYRGCTLDVVAILENSFLFAADLVRAISCPVICHFVRAEVRAVDLGGVRWPEVFFSTPPRLAGRHVLLLDAMLNTGVTQSFLWQRFEECRPRSLRLAVLFDREKEHKVNLKPTYVGFANASKYWVGYGLAGPDGLYRNLPYVGKLTAVSAAGSKSKVPPEAGSRAKSSKQQKPRV